MSISIHPYKTNNQTSNVEYNHHHHHHIQFFLIPTTQTKHHPHTRPTKMEVLSHEVTIPGDNGEPRTLRIPVVQELALRHGANTQEPVPKMFIHPNPNSLNIQATTCPPQDFPSVSLARLRAADPTDRARELERLAAGAKDWGVLLVSDHGIPNSLLGDVKEVVDGFFELPFEEKKESVGTYDDTDNLGYGRNFVMSEHQVLDWVDRLSMVVAPRHATHGLNVWPQKPTNFREVIEKYAEEGRKLGNELLQALAESLSLDPNAFTKHFNPETSEIKARINYYPPCPTPDSTMGLTPHSDSSGLSLLIQFHSSGGLHVLHKHHPDRWVSVPWPVDGLLVIVGDLLEIMSHGRVRSPVHRAVTRADARRVSVALFCNPPASEEIEPVEREEGEDVYRKVVVGDYLRHFYSVHPRTKQAAIRFAMV